MQRAVEQTAAAAVGSRGRRAAALAVLQGAGGAGRWEGERIAVPGDPLRDSLSGL